MPTMAAEPTYVPSRYMSMRFESDGSLLLHSSRTGSIGTVPTEDSQLARSALLPGRHTVGPLTGILKEIVGSLWFRFRAVRRSWGVQARLDL